MHRNILYGGLILFLFGSLFLFSQQVGRANPSIAEPRLSGGSQPKSSVLDAKDDKCKDKNGKEKKNCPGTVKPPPGKLIIPVTGDYSVGGYCTLTVVLTEPAVNLDANLIEPLPAVLPETVFQTRQGCLLTYHRSSETLLELAPASGSVTICFAATPGKQMIVYFYNQYAETPTWMPLAETTTLENGITCAPANASGVYTATFPL
jgi:hypothetical protein